MNFKEKSKRRIENWDDPKGKSGRTQRFPGKNLRFSCKWKKQEKTW